MGEHDDLHARAADVTAESALDRAFRRGDPLATHQEAHALVADLAAALRAVEAERDELRRRLDAARKAYDPEHADWDALETALGFAPIPEGESIAIYDIPLDVPAADPASGEDDHADQP